jgi:hypothetical protein
LSSGSISAIPDPLLIIIALAIAGIVLVGGAMFLLKDTIDVD